MPVTDTVVVHKAMQVVVTLAVVSAAVVLVAFHHLVMPMEVLAMI
jgi:hypothetical protein